MKVVEVHSHCFGQQISVNKSLYDEIIAALCINQIGISKGNSRLYKSHVEKNLSALSWIKNPVVDEELKLTINAMKDKVGLTVQMGNIARAFYDLLKFQSMYINGKIDMCVLVLPTHAAARTIGTNVANINRVKAELNLFKHIITVPCLVIGIDE